MIEQRNVEICKMIHFHTETNPQEDHYAVGVSGGISPLVLVQLMGSFQGTLEQVRIPLTVDEARHMANLLLDAAKMIEDHK